MEDDHDASWTRALMATSGITFSVSDAPAHLPAEWHEASAVGTPIARLQKLAMHRHPDVRAAVARRLDCPIGVLASLAHDRVTSVRCAVASNPRLVTAVAEQLMRDRDVAVLKSLARNDAVSLTILQALALSRKEDVRHVAARRLDARVHGGDAARLSPRDQAALAGQLEPPPGAPQHIVTWMPTVPDTPQHKLA